MLPRGTIESRVNFLNLWLGFKVVTNGGKTFVSWGIAS
jgi:hypothetical protein